MKRYILRCTGVYNDKKCNNILGYISESQKFICNNNGRKIEMDCSSVGGSIVIRCEVCGAKNKIQMTRIWKKIY